MRAYRFASRDRFAARSLASCRSAGSHSFGAGRVCPPVMRARSTVFLETPSAAAISCAVMFWASSPSVNDLKSIKVVERLTNGSYLTTFRVHGAGSIVNTGGGVNRSRQWNELRQQVTEEQGFLCWYCAGIIRSDKGAPIVERAELDHKNPRRQGGTDERDNLVAACQRCNAQKCARTVEEYRDFLREANPFVKLFRSLDTFEGEVSRLPDSADALREWLLEHWPTIRFHGERDGR